MKRVLTGCFVLAIVLTLTVPMMAATNYSGYWWLCRDATPDGTMDPNPLQHKMKLTMTTDMEFEAVFLEPTTDEKITGTIVERDQTVLVFRIENEKADYWAFFSGVEVTKNQKFEGGWYSTGTKNNRGDFYMKRGASCN